MRRRSQYLLLSTMGVLPSSSVAMAQCPSSQALRWPLAAKDGGSHPVFVPTNAVRANYRVCVDARVRFEGRSHRAPASDAAGLEVRIACGPNGTDLQPPCAAITGLKPGSYLEI
jgi:hypothetical protein